MALEVVPAHRAPWEDLVQVFGTRGTGQRCWCQRYKLFPGESFGGFPAEERAERMREQTGCDVPGSTETSGLVAYDDGTPVGWAAVEPRPRFHGLVRHQKVPWAGRDEDRADESVWAITCLFVRSGHRRRGVSRELAHAAVAYAREAGARAVEAYPMTTTRAIDEELHVGLLEVYLEAGLREVARPTARRAVVRLDLRAAGDA